MSDTKYKIFRNFMANELGISGDDIKEWTMEAVRETVEKHLRGFEAERLIKQTAQETIRSSFAGMYEAKERIREAIAKMLTNEYTISIVKKEEAKQCC